MTDLTAAEIAEEKAEMMCRAAFKQRHAGDARQLERVAMAVTKLAQGEQLRLTNDGWQ